MVWPFRRPTYEQKLSNLAERIRVSQNNITRREMLRRRLRGLLLIYSTMLYIVYVVFAAATKQIRSVQFATILCGVPVSVYMLRRLLDSIFLWSEGRLKRQLEQLMEQRDEAIADFKKETKYDKIQRVLREASAEPEPAAQTFPAEMPNGSSGGTASAAAGVPPLVGYQQQRTHTWMDRILDLVLGEDEQSPNNRFALICANCRSHNGLAEYGENPENVIYVCPMCGYKNGRDKSESIGTEKVSAAHVQQEEPAAPSETELHETTGPETGQLST